jgi:hypothetical protein
MGIFIKENFSSTFVHVLMIDKKRNLLNIHNKDTSCKKISPPVPLPEAEEGRAMLLILSNQIPETSSMETRKKLRR